MTRRGIPSRGTAVRSAVVAPAVVGTRRAIAGQAVAIAGQAAVTTDLVFEILAGSLLGVGVLAGLFIWSMK